MIKLTPLTSEVIELPPLPPFTTDTLLSEASALFRFSAPLTMKLAQDLFELGLITYHRTDSTRISSTGITIAREYLDTTFGEYAKQVFVPRLWGEGGAHEGIRPTKPIDAEKLRELIAEGVIETPIRLTPKHYKLYDLIFRRFIASQMKSAKIERTTYLVEVYMNGMKVHETMVSIITDVIDPGYMSVYTPIRILNIPKEEVFLKPSSIEIKYVSDIRTPTQGELIRWMKEVGIGRPSTYAKIVEVLLRRRYVRERKFLKTLIPRARGILVYSLLAGLYMPETRDELEKELDYTISLIARIKPRKYTHEEMKNILLSITRNVKPSIQQMVTVDRTSALQKYMQLIEEGESDYEEVLRELFKEMCENVLAPELKKVPIEVCRL